MVIFSIQNSLDQKVTFISNQNQKNRIILTISVNFE